MSEETF